MKKIKLLIMGALSLLFINCSSDSEEKCYGKIVIETKYLEFRYLNEKGDLVTFGEGEFKLKMIGERPVVCNLNGEVAEKYVGVRGSIREVINENASFDCGKSGEVIYDGVRTHEENKEYDYILEGWSQQIKYYESK